MPERVAIEDQLRSVGAVGDDAIDIGEAALLLAALDRPRVALDRYRDHLAALAQDLIAAGARGPEDRVEALRAVLVGRHGYAGDTLTYEDVQNANLMRVIDRRKGLPVTLGILFIHSAETAGWTMVGLSFPFHFLVRLEEGRSRIALDPFNGGEVVDSVGMRKLLGRFTKEIDLKPEFYQPVTKRDVLVRLQNNIKSRALRAEDLARAADVLRRILLFAPAQATLWRELSSIEGSRGNLRDAIAAAQEYFKRATNDAMRHDAAHLLQQHKSRLN
ncbi:MAG: hypothetical protein EXQ85_00835 [Alphaproteobacteria bacterium]|nr:hypothetical protein [Alphaproteobacteria bacterium]